MEGGRVAARTITDARVVDVVRGLVWQVELRSGRMLMTPEGLYGSSQDDRAGPPPAAAGCLGGCGGSGDAAAGSVRVSTLGQGPKMMTIWHVADTKLRRLVESAA